MSKVYISLTHGRTTPDESLSGWGPDGPVFGPFDWVHTTYATDIRCGDDGHEKVIELSINEDCVYYGGMWYGDWTVFAGELNEHHKARLIEWDETKTTPAKESK